jgi:tetratricopeptide (TPR) repeat protein
LSERILVEPVQDKNRLVLWLPGARADGSQYWERLSSVVRAEISVSQGLGAIPVTSVPARQRQAGLLGRLWRRFRPADGDRTFLLPNGETAEACGEPQTDLLFVWAEINTSDLDEARLQLRWPGSKRLEKLGKNLYLVAHADAPPASNEVSATPPPEESRELAEQLLAAARQSGDLRQLAAALADAGALCLREKDVERAVVLLKEALEAMRRLGDRSGEGDVLRNLGIVALEGGQPGQALGLFDQALACARAVGDRFAAKLVMEYLGMTHLVVRDPGRATSILQEALGLARELGDRRQEAILLWYLAIASAVQGQRDRALAEAQAAVDLLKKMGSPEAVAYAEHLLKYRANDNGQLLAAGWEAHPGSAPGQMQAASWLLKAASAARAAARFLGSGLKTVSPATRAERLRTCAACEHHTGIRCRLCGCFTRLKSWLPHESCPVGKWPG